MASFRVTWTPDTATNTGKLNYTIYKQGHQGSRNISYSDNTTYDGTDFISYDVAIGSPEYSLQRVFGVNDLNNSVYWGFSGSTGGFLNNQAVQMVQLPISYYEAELRKEDQEGDLITDATFNLENTMLLLASGVQSSFIILTQGTGLRISRLVHKMTMLVFMGSIPKARDHQINSTDRRYLPLERSGACGRLSTRPSLLSR